jgi:hypothetical protein
MRNLQPFHANGRCILPTHRLWRRWTVIDYGYSNIDIATFLPIFYIDPKARKLDTLWCLRENQHKVYVGFNLRFIMSLYYCKIVCASQ